MIASKIGKTFLSVYNQKYEKNYSSKEFFTKELFPLFYDHPKYMQWVTNSPFVQGLSSTKDGTYGLQEIIKDISGKTLLFEKQEEVANTISELSNTGNYLELTAKKKAGKNIYFINGLKKLSKIERSRILSDFQNKLSHTKPDASIAIGFPSQDLIATTSGQITNIDLDIDEEEVYASWIGGGFGVGVQGGLAIYFDIPEILMTIYHGWQLYRNYLEEMSKLRPNQIDTWNGQWLSHACSRYYNEMSPTAMFEEPFSTMKDGRIEIKTQSWVKVLHGISQRFPQKNITGYVFSLGQTNTTIGFIQFSLSSLRKPIHFYKTLFGENDFLNNAKTIEELLGSEFTFRQSCTKGRIGVKALQPKGLMPFIRIRDGDLKLPKLKKPDIKIKNNEDEESFTKRKNEAQKGFSYQYVTFKTYESWIMATLNNETLYDKATQYAQCFIEYEKGAGQGKTDRKNHVKNALSASSKRKLVDALTDIVKNQPIELLDELVREITKMPADNFPYFLTLIRFRYAYLNEN